MNRIIAFSSCILMFMVHSSELLESHQKELNRIKKYELIDVNVDQFESNRIIEFDAFQHHYIIQLNLNENVIPTMLHQKEDGTVAELEDEEWESCHYHGTVLNSANSRIALSLCKEEGIRGRIKAFGDRLYINPKTYYFDPSKSTALSDKHLIYKATDYDWEAEAAEEEEDELEEEEEEEYQEPPLPQDSTIHRRLLGAGTVEILLLIDANWVDYKGSVSSTKNYFSGIVNQAADIYGELPSDIRLNLKWGYAVFEDFGTSGKSVYKSKCPSYQSKTEHDWCFLFMRNGGSGGGVGAVNGVCNSNRAKGGYWSTTDKKLPIGMAHELGHNLMQSDCMEYAKSGGGYNHDPKGSCYIMSPSSCDGGWSSRTEKCFRQNTNKWDCLERNKMGSFQYDDNIGGGYSNDNNDNNNNNNNNGGGSCIKLSSFSNGLNGKWSSNGDGYSKDNSQKTLSQMRDSGVWYWGVNDGWDYGWCDKSDIVDCSRRWEDEGGTVSGSIRESSSCNGAYTYAECFEDYAETVYFYHEGEFVFERVDDEGCLNDAPVFRRVDGDEEEVWLSWNGYEWTMSEGEILYMNGTLQLACEKENLYECTAGNWFTEVEQDDTLSYYVLEHAVIQGQRLVESADQKEHLSSGAMLVIALGLVALVSLLFYWYYSSAQMKEKGGVKIGDESDMEEEEENEETEIVYTVTN